MTVNGDAGDHKLTIQVGSARAAATYAAGKAIVDENATRAAITD